MWGGASRLDHMNSVENSAVVTSIARKNFSRSVSHSILRAISPSLCEYFHYTSNSCLYRIHLSISHTNNMLYHNLKKKPPFYLIVCLLCCVFCSIFISFLQATIILIRETRFFPFLSLFAVVVVFIFSGYYLQRIRNKET